MIYISERKNNKKEILYVTNISFNYFNIQISLFPFSVTQSQFIDLKRKQAYILLCICVRLSKATISIFSSTTASDTDTSDGSDIFDFFMARKAGIADAFVQNPSIFGLNTLEFSRNALLGINVIHEFLTLAPALKVGNVFYTVTFE